MSDGTKLNPIAVCEPRVEIGVSGVIGLVITRSPGADGKARENGDHGEHPVNFVIVAVVWEFPRRDLTALGFFALFMTVSYVVSQYVFGVHMYVNFGLAAIFASSVAVIFDSSVAEIFASSVVAIFASCGILSSSSEESP